MKMPNGYLAYATRDKLVGYLLNSWHPDGHSKAAYFRNAGFVPEAWQGFAEALAEVGRNGLLVAVSVSGYGQRFMVDGNLRCPDGNLRAIRTVWIVPRGTVAPRLITAHPLKAKE